jgi:hypothetical protein
MPRHPPCALHSLSHTPPTQPHPPNTQEPGPPPNTEEPRNPGNRGWARLVMHTHDSPQKNQRTPDNHPVCAYNKHATHHHPHRQNTAGGVGPVARCSRPLSRSQTTTPHPTTRPLTGPATRPGRNRSTKLTPDSSEPQQCVHRLATSPTEHQVLEQADDGGLFPLD